MARLKAYVHRFDQESYWVAAEVEAPGRTKEQAGMIVLFVQAAEHCLELGNFFTLFSILGLWAFRR